MTEEQNNLPQIPKGWGWTPLEFSCQKITDGAHFTPKYVQKGYPFITIRDISGGIINFSSAKLISKDDYEKLKGNCNPHNGDVLFSKDGTIGRVVEIDFEKEFILLSSLAIIRPYPDLVFQRYLKYLLQSILVLNQCITLRTGTALTRIILRNLRKVKIPIPPLPEQHRIIVKIEELFAKLDAGVESLKNVKTQLQRYRQAVLKHAFQGRLTEEWRKTHKDEIEPASVLLERIKEELRKKAKGKYKELPPADTPDLPQLPKDWVWTSIREINFLVTKGSTPTSYGFSYVSQGINFVKVENIANGRIVGRSIKEFITEDTHKFLKRSQLTENDVLFSIAGTIGRIAIVHHDDLPANTNQALAIIRCPWQYVSPQFLKAFLESFMARSSIEKKPRGVGMNNISLGDVENIVYPFAPLSEQRKIVEEIEQRFSVADEIENVVEQSLKQAMQLRQSILKKAFEGRLVPQDPTDEPAEKLLEQIRKKKEKRNIEEKKKRGKKSKRKGRLKQVGLTGYVK